MAAEEIKLVGVFRDEITPKLKKLNKEINATTKNFGRMRRQLQPIARDFEKISNSVERVSRGMNSQNRELKEATVAMSKYRTQVRRTASEQKKLRPMSGGMAGGGRRGGGMAMGGGIGMGGIIGGNIAASFITDAIYRGFEMGVQLMMAPFKMLANAIKDGIEDEMSDIQSAGGMYALDKKASEADRIFGNFIQARNFQEELNRELAMSAASLPGATEEYVQSAKQLTDTVFGTFNKGAAEFAGLAGGLGGQEGATDKENITTVLKKFTEQSVLLSQGSKGGMPLGMLLEQLISQDVVNISSYKRRYKQLRSNPLLANMLEDAEEAINASGAMTADRFKAVMGALDNALPQEVVNSMRRSVAGVTEAIRSGLFDQEVGLLGLRRPLETEIAAINEFGQYIDENGKVVLTAAEAAKEQTTIFKMFRDIIAGFGLPISEIVGILPEVFDPLLGMASALEDLRQASIDFSQAVTRYTNFFKQEGFDQAGARGALAGFNKMLADLGGLSADQAMENALKLEDKDFKPAAMVQQMLSDLIDSDFAAQIGEAIGGIVGAIFKVITDMINGTLGALEGEGGNKFIQGLTKGFDDAMGGASFTNALADLFKYAAQQFTTALVEIGIPILLDAFGGVVGGLADSGIVGQLILVTGTIVALGTAIGVVSGIISAVGVVITTVSGIISGIGTVLSVIAPALSMFSSVMTYIVSGALVPFIATIAAVAGAVMLVIAVVRNFGDIVTIAAESVKSGVGLFLQAISTLVGGLGNVLGFIPGLGDVSAGLKKAGEDLKGFGGNMTTEAVKAVQGAAQGIADQTKADVAAINKSIGIGGGEEKKEEGGKAWWDPMGVFTGKKETTPAPAAPVGVPAAPVTSAAPAFSPTANMQTIKQSTDYEALAAAKAATEANTASVKAVEVKVNENVTKATEQVAKTGEVITKVAEHSVAVTGKMDEVVAAVTQKTAEQPVRVMNELLRVSIANMPVAPGMGSGVAAKYKGSSSTMSLGDAVATEQKNKPAGSNLVIANSSEAVIPAYNGYVPTGMGGGGKEINVGDINVTVQGSSTGSPQETAELVAAEIMTALQKSTYNELFTS